jgi:hypothetical protein
MSTEAHNRARHAFSITEKQTLEGEQYKQLEGFTVSAAPPPPHTKVFQIFRRQSRESGLCGVFRGMKNGSRHDRKALREDDNSTHNVGSRGIEFRGNFG